VPTLRLDLEYDGARFAGWAAQPGLRTVEGVLRAALDTVLRSPVADLRVAGRTDAGVSASGQVVSLVVPVEADVGRLLRALNGTLPQDVAVLAAKEAPDGFDARADARGRAYEYRVLPRLKSPLRLHRVLHVPVALDVEALRAAAAAVVGRHDFRAFTPTKTEHVFFDRTVTACAWTERGDEVVLRIEADAFLRHMVRVLVGSMLLVGRGHWDVARFTRLLDGLPRAAAGPTAPPHPLTLVAVRYSDERRSAGRRDAPQ
jgi:tRNA pseudouridine38-40 synthase